MFIITEKSGISLSFSVNVNRYLFFLSSLNGEEEGA